MKLQNYNDESCSLDSQFRTDMKQITVLGLNAPQPTIHMYLCVRTSCMFTVPCIVATKKAMSDNRRLT